MELAKAASALLMLWAILSGASAAASPLDLLADPSRWSVHLDGRGARMTPAAVPRGIAVDVTADGGSEDYPKLRLTYSSPQDWSGYIWIRARLRITSTDPGIHAKDIAFVFYDRGTGLSGKPEPPMEQQVLRHGVAAGQWIDLRDSLAVIHRAAIRGIDIYVYELPPGRPHTYRWEIEKLELTGPDGGEAILDGRPLAMGEVGPGGGVASVHADDGLSIELDRQGDIVQVRSGGRILGKGSRTPTGFLVRDVAEDEAAVAVGGIITQEGADVRQTSRLERLGLDIQAAFHDAGGYIEISGSVSDLRGEDRAITLYFALPTIDGPWEWWDSVAESRTGPGGSSEFAAVETGMDYGLGGAHSKYPVGAISLPGRDGLTLAIRMDEPVVHRFAYNQKLRLFYVAFDFGLVNEPRAGGGSLSVAPFRILVYRHDPSWGFRSALERYYGFFPGFFTQRLAKQGGWYVWGNMSETEGALDAGFAFHWGPRDAEAVKWDNANGPLALLYVEPETFQETFEDFDRKPNPEEALDRLRLLAGGDPHEVAGVAALPYRVYPLQVGGDPRERIRESARVALGSLSHDPDGRPYSVIDRFDWMSRSRWGAIFLCNLSPSIPGGKGEFTVKEIIEPALQQMTGAGGRYDGIGLDGSGGYGQFARADYRREYFRYSRFPLSFSAATHAPVAVASFSTAAWLKDLSERMHAQGKILMANCSWAMTPGWLTFAAPYLDVFGAEAPHFADPDFIRAIAYRKACTDLPLEPPPAWEVPWHLLQDIYPGAGNDLLALRRYESLLRDLAAAGWEPVTGARVSPPKLRLERYGAGNRGPVYLVLHNPGDEESVATMDIDLANLALDGGGLSAAAVPIDRPIELEGSRLSLRVGPRETVAIRLSRNGE